MFNSKVLKIALLGCGAVSELYYAPALRELEKSELLQVKALFDPNPERLVKLNQVFPLATRLENLTEISNLDIDLAIIASPPRYHAEQAIQVLKSGVSVLCEKPMATTVTEGKAMIEAASAAQRVFAVGLFRRFFPATQAIHQILSLNLLGDVKSFYCYEGGPFRWPVQSASYFHKNVAEGGVLLDIGTHLFDLLIWWFGQPVEIFYEDDAIGGIEANCHIKLRFAPGFEGEVRLSRDWSLPNRYVIQCEKGWVSWNVNEADRIQWGFHNTNLALSSQLYENGHEYMHPALGRPGLNFEQSFTEQLRNVVSAIHGIEPLVVPGEQGLQSLRLIEHCYHHRTLMPMPWLSEKEYARARRIITQSLQC